MSVRRSVGPYVPCYLRILGASCAVYPALFQFSLNFQLFYSILYGSSASPLPLFISSMSLLLNAKNLHFLHSLQYHFVLFPYHFRCMPQTFITYYHEQIPYTAYKQITCIAILSRVHTIHDINATHSHHHFTPDKRQMTPLPFDPTVMPPCPVSKVPRLYPYYPDTKYPHRPSPFRASRKCHLPPLPFCLESMAPIIFDVVGTT